MINIPELLAQELALNIAYVQNALALQAEGATVPFIARYRKERTGEMNEIVLRNLFDRNEYLTELEERKTVILNSISEQGKLTDELKAKIEACLQKNELEDLYLPFKPKRRTRATIAREKGLEPLAEAIKSCNVLGASLPKPLLSMAEEYVSSEKGVNTPQEALFGASDILAEEVSEKAELRARIREFIVKNAVIASSVKEEFPEGSTKFEMYRTYKAALSDIQPHNMLALRRGEAEGVLLLDIQFDEEYVMSYMEREELRSANEELRSFYKQMLNDAFERLIKNTLIGEVRLEKKLQADAKSIDNFGVNLRNLLLSSPAGMKPTLGIDPGFRTGCKMVAVDATGKMLEYRTIFPHASSTAERNQAAEHVKDFLRKYRIELIAIGNGTAGRETEEFISEVLSDAADIQPKPIKVTVNESGASVYSASEVAIEEFPTLDLTVRGAISIARRLQDPLAELVKIDPKSIGVGQYQHDVDQKLLKKKLEETVESCVNYVGVDVNTASKELLKYVAGITETVAKNIVEYRNQHGAFSSRQELTKVTKFGPKTFEQAAGFLRIRGGANPLDNSSVHPERYAIVQQIADDVGVPLGMITKSPEQLRGVSLKKYITDDVGEPTLRDILKELEKPGRDPREEFRYAEFQSGINQIQDLRPGMWLEGVVTNVTNFGAFVDVGVHQDGLVHISQLADRFVAAPTDVVNVGQIVRVRVVEVNVGLKRISLSMKSEPTGEGGKKSGGGHHSGKQMKKSDDEQMTDNLAKLKQKFAKV